METVAIGSWYGFIIILKPYSASKFTFKNRVYKAACHVIDYCTNHWY